MDIAMELGFNESIIQQFKKNTKELQNIFEDIDPEYDLEEAQSQRKKCVEILKGNLLLVEKSVDRSKVDDHRYAAIVAEINMNIGMMLLKAEKDDQKHGEGDGTIEENCLKYFKRAESYLTTIEAYTETSVVAININNVLGDYYTWKKDFENALKYLKKAENLYKRNAENIDSITLVDARRLFDMVLQEYDDEDEDNTQGREVPNSILMKSRHSETLRYYCLLYFEMNLIPDALEHKFRELNAILEMKGVKEDKGLGWVMALANLAHLFMTEGCFEQVNYCLYVAEQQLNNLEASYWGYVNRRDIAAHGNKIYDIGTEMMLKFLAHSGARLKGMLKAPNDETLNRLKKLKLPIFEEGEENFKVENIIPNEPVTNFNDAKEVFLKIQKDSEKRKKRMDIFMNAYYRLECDQWISKAYLCLTAFEEQADRRAKIHKRRVDLFEKSKHEFTAGGDHIFKNLVCHDLAEAYDDLLDAKLQQFFNEEKTIEEVKVKVNRLRQMAILNFRLALDFERKAIGNNFVNSSRTSQVLESCRRLALAYMKIVTDNANDFIKCIKLAMAEFRYFINYCESNADVKKEMNQHYSRIKIHLKNLSKKIVELRNDPDSFDLIEEFNSLYAA